MTTANTNIDNLVRTISQMNRDDVKREIMCFEGRFKLDFTPEFLESQSLDSLRHILYAAKIQQQQEMC